MGKLRIVRDYFVIMDGLHGEDYEHKFRLLPEAMAFYDSITARTAAYKKLVYDDDKRGTITVKSEVLV